MLFVTGPLIAEIHAVIAVTGLEIMLDWRIPRRQYTGGSGSLTVRGQTYMSPRVLGFQVGDRRAAVTYALWIAPQLTRLSGTSNATQLNCD